MSSELDVRLDLPLPGGLVTGSKVVLPLIGACFHPGRRIQSLSVDAGEGPVPVRTDAMPRRDLYEALHFAGTESAEDPGGHSFRSGFWIDLPVTMGASPMEIVLIARLEGGGEARVGLAAIEPARAPLPVFGVTPTWTGTPRVAITMATWNPDPELLAAQIDSIRAQTIEDWICLISDDCSDPEGVETITGLIEGDPRFIFSRSEERLGHYRNFERALEAVPREIPYVAMADQDDRWYPEKLEVLLDEIGDSRLVFSDQRIVSKDGVVIAESYWTERDNNHESLISMLIANTVTGAASLFDTRLLEVALPFPLVPGSQYHDQWLALTAMATGGLAWVDRPLYDYVQHGGATLGHQAATHAKARVDLRTMLARVKRGEWQRLASGWRAAYFLAYRRICVLAETLLLRCGEQIGRSDGRQIRRFIKAERSPVGFLWLAARSQRPRFGHNETLGAEKIITQGILWRRLIGAASTGRRKPIPGLPYDASMPAVEVAKTADIDHPVARNMGNLILPLDFSLNESAPRRVNLLVPTVELKHFFGGYITKFNLARKLAESGHRTRILTADATPQLPRDWKQRVESYAGLEGMFDQVEIAFARDLDAPVEISPEDSFIATTWWTAHIAARAIRQTSHDRFLYLIQEYEPYTHPMGSWAALAMSTYEMPHTALFSTELLRDFFRERSYGVFMEGEARGLELSASFQNAITEASPPSVEEMAARERPTLLFYARPEAHGARNMFELGLLGLSEAVARGIFGPEWNFRGIGSVEGGDVIGLGSGRSLEVLARTDQSSYGELLARHDVGLALMCTPHPSLVPLEMASAGLVTVTNSFETKTAEQMSALSSNLIASPPSLEGVVSGLAEAVARSGDFESRVAGAAVDWSSDWEESFGPKTMEQINRLLKAG